LEGEQFIVTHDPPAAVEVEPTATWIWFKLVG
jgi:hypothetical protein